MVYTKYFRVIALIISISGFAVFAQTAVKSSITSKEDKAKLELEKKAFATLEQVINEAGALKLPENRILILAAATELLWERDEKRARSLAVSVANEIRAQLSERENTGLSQFAMEKLRHRFLLRTAKNDADLALELLAQTRPAILVTQDAPDAYEQSRLKRLRENELELEQAIAFEIAEKDAAKGLRFGREVLARGIDSQILNLLLRLQRKDLAAANKFADEIVTKLLSANFVKDDEAQDTTQNFLVQLDEDNGVFGSPVLCGCKTKPLTVERKKLHDLADKFFNHLLAENENRAAQDFVYTLPVLEKLLPERAAELQAKRIEFEKTNPRFARELQKREMFKRKISPVAVAAEAGKLPDGERLSLYNDAFVEAANTSKTSLEALREEVLKHSDGKDRKYILGRIDGMLAAKTAGDGDLAKARQSASQIEPKSERIAVLSHIASRYLEKGERAAALEIMNEVALLLDLKKPISKPHPLVRTNVTPSVITNFARLQPEFAFWLAEPMILQAAEQLAAKNEEAYPSDEQNNGSTRKTPYQPEFRERDGEIELPTVSNFLFVMSYSKAIKYLADADFERTQRATNLFPRTEINILAKLFLAQAILKDQIGFREDFQAMRDKVVIKD